MKFIQNHFMLDKLMNFIAILILLSAALIVHSFILILHVTPKIYINIIQLTILCSLEILNFYNIFIAHFFLFFLIHILSLCTQEMKTLSQYKSDFHIHSKRIRSVTALQALKKHCNVLRIKCVNILAPLHSHSLYIIKYIRVPFFVLSLLKYFQESHFILNWTIFMIKNE